MRTESDQPVLPEENVYGHTKKLRFILGTIAALKERLGRPPRVLDFGCGNGEAVSRFIIAAECEYCGVDSHLPSLEHARRRFGGPTAQFITEIPPNATFDVLVYSDFLEHILNPAEILTAHTRLLAPGGLVVGSVPNGYGPYEIEQRIDRWLQLSRIIGIVLRWRRRLLLRATRHSNDPPYNQQSGHVYFFTCASLAACAATAGLRIVKWQNGALLGANLSGLVVGRSRHLREWNIRIADFMPAWAVSTWYFVLERANTALASSTLQTKPPAILRREEAIALIRKFRRFPGSRIEIMVDDIECVAKRDVVEIYSRFVGARCLHWVDTKKRIRPRSGLARNLVNIFVGALRGVAIVWRCRIEAARISRIRQRAPLKSTSRLPWACLYLRTDHWFNVVSGGSVAHTAGVINALRDLGIDTEVVSTDVLTNVANDSRLHVVRPDYEAIGNFSAIPELAYNRRAIEFAAELLKDRRVGFVYQRLSEFNVAGAALRRLHGVPYVCEYNGSATWMSRHWYGRRMALEQAAQRLEKVALASADLIVVVSDASRDDLLRRGLPSTRILVNPNGVDPEIYRPDLDGSVVRARFGIEERRVLGFIGTFGPWHGAEVLASAFVDLLNRRPDLRQRVRLLMVGDGQRRAAAEEIIRLGGCAAAAIFTGRIPQSEAPNYLAAADILVSPHVPNSDGSPFFGSPTKLFEYMAMGRPIVASELDQIATVLEDGVSASLVKPGDLDALSIGIEKVLNDYDGARRLGSNARHEVLQNYSWHAHTKRILEAIQTTIAPNIERSVRKGVVSTDRVA